MTGWSKMKERHNSILAVVDVRVSCYKETPQQDIKTQPYVRHYF